MTGWASPTCQLCIQVLQAPVDVNDIWRPEITENITFSNGAGIKRKKTLRTDEIQHSHFSPEKKDTEKNHLGILDIWAAQKLRFCLMVVNNWFVVADGFLKVTNKSASIFFASWRFVQFLPPMFYSISKGSDCKGIPPKMCLNQIKLRIYNKLPRSWRIFQKQLRLGRYGSVWSTRWSLRGSEIGSIRDDVQTRQPARF